MEPLLSEYALRQGSGLDRALLVKFMQRTYQELYPEQNFTHLAQTVEQYLSPDTPLWWVVAEQQNDPIACLWMGNVTDQVQGDRHAYIFLLYVHPNHRQRGIASALMHRAETWAKARGDRQIGLQVFQGNQPAQSLYQKLGYRAKAIWLVKPLRSDH
jgi:ribosomal protein S18 acetylase RimI-like enzyme